MGKSLIYNEKCNLTVFHGTVVQSVCLPSMRIKLMSPVDYNSPDMRVCSPERSAAVQTEYEAQQAVRAAKLPINRLRALAPGESVLFEQYSHPSQVSNPMARLHRNTDMWFEARTQRCPGDGSIEGVLVTRVK